MIINIYLVLFFKHFEWMRLLIGHIYALQAVDVPDEDVDDDHVDEDVDDDVDGDIDIDIDDHGLFSYFGRQDLVICVSPASMAST